MHRIEKRSAVYCAILRTGLKKNGSVYNPETWDDNDSSTWTWQIDHIIPQKVLIYDSMDHPNFKLCWALDNLRPYSSKANIMDRNRI